MTETEWEICEEDASKYASVYNWIDRVFGERK